MVARQCNMGIGPLGQVDLAIKQKHRWVLSIDGIIGATVGLLPPAKAGRPSLSFKETEFEHLSETIYYPMKPQWKPINVTVYDIINSNNQIFNWIAQIYDASLDASFGFTSEVANTFKKDVDITLLDGCGDVLENWHLDSAFPNNIEWGELDMADSGVVMIDLTLRYDRAYVT